MARLTSTTTPLVRAFSREFARAGGLLAPDYLASGFSLGEVRCLYELGQSDDLSVSALGERLSLDLGYVSRAVSKLVASGLVTKRVARDDERARRLSLTAKGRAELAVLGRRADDRLGAWLATKPTAAVEELASGLRAFVGEADGRITLRPARPGDAGHVIARHAEVYVGELGYPTAFEGYVIDAFADFFRSQQPERDRLFVAELGGRVVASIAVKGLPRRRAQLRFLLVEPQARGRGLGRRLVRRVIEHARACGERRVVLETASDLVAARRLYETQGFRKTNEERAEWLPTGVMSERWERELGDRRARSAASAA